MDLLEQLRNNGIGLCISAPFSNIGGGGELPGLVELASGEVWFALTSISSDSVDANTLFPAVTWSLAKIASRCSVRVSTWATSSDECHISRHHVSIQYSHYHEAYLAEVNPTIVNHCHQPCLMGAVLGRGSKMDGSGGAGCDL
jgi:hypothetical protein